MPFTNHETVWSWDPLTVAESDGELSFTCTVNGPDGDISTLIPIGLMVTIAVANCVGAAAGIDVDFKPHGLRPA